MSPTGSDRGHVHSLEGAKVDINLVGRERFCRRKMVKQGRWKMWCSEEVMNGGGLLPRPEGCGCPEGSGGEEVADQGWPLCCV